LNVGRFDKGLDRPVNQRIDRNIKAGFTERQNNPTGEMKVPLKSYKSQKWLVHELANDFSLIDCWMTDDDTRITNPRKSLDYDVTVSHSNFFSGS